MTKTIPLARRIQLLLNTLVGERYVRRPLLLELRDDLTASDEHADLVEAVRLLLERVEAGIDEGEYEQRVEQLREMTARRTAASLAPRMRPRLPSMKASRTAGWT